MKKILLLIILFVISFNLIGCVRVNFDDGDGDPIGIGEDVPISVTITSYQGKVKILINETLQLYATVFPETANQAVTWSSNDLDIATVSNTGLITGISEGRVKITATTVDGTKSSYFYLTVEKPVEPITSIEIVGNNEVFVDDIIKLNYSLTPSNDNASVIWSSSNENIASVDYNGRVKGLSEGNVIISVICNNTLTDTINIVVKARTGTPNDISIKGRDIIEVNETVKLYVEVLPIGSLNSMIWTSSNIDIATVNELGIVTAKQAGTVQINAKSNINESVTANFEIEIVDTTINTDNLQQNVIDVIAQTKNSIFGVSNYVYNENGILTKQSIGSGSVYKTWFILNDNSVIYDINDIISYDDVKTYCYYLITNRHVVEGSDAVKIYLHEEDKEIDATLLQYDDKVDIAVIYFEYSKYIKPLKFADTDTIEAGQFAVAIGNPSGYEYSSSATFGIISHPKRYISDDTDGDGVSDWDAEYIQHDVAINPGNSGGPLLNLNGEIIGMNTMKFASTDIDNMGFSVPSNVITDLIPLLEKGEKPVRALLGITVITINDLLNNPDPNYSVPNGVNFGAYVITVNSTGVAGKAGVLPHDIIQYFNDVPIKTSVTLRAELGKIVVGSNQLIDIQVYRNGEIITLTLTF